MKIILNIPDTLCKRLVFIGDKLIDRDSYYTTKQVEFLLGVDKCTIERRVREGYLKRSGSARNIFYKGQHIIDYLDNKLYNFFLYISISFTNVQNVKICPYNSNTKRQIYIRYLSLLYKTSSINI